MKRMILLVLAAQVCACAAAEESSVASFLDARASGDRRTYEKSAEKILEEARAGYPVQQFLVAVVSREPDCPPAARVDDAERDRFLELSRYRIRGLAQKSDNPTAWYLLSMEKGDVQLLKKAASLDELRALNEMGVLRLQAARKITSSEKRRFETMREAFGCFTRAATKNDMNAFYNLGMCYLNGWGCRKDMNLALENLRIAASMGQPKAMSQLGEIYRDGTGVDRDEMQAVRYFVMAANHWNAEGQYNYAKELLAGKGGLEPNPSRAVDLLKRSALQGKTEAINAYAECLRDGTGFEPETNGLAQVAFENTMSKWREDNEKRHREAFKLWARLAKDAKHPPSMDRLGMCYLDGIGVEKNERLGFVWLSRSADAGCVSAMDHIAECWDLGRGGLDKNHYNANWWRTCAQAERGDRNAKVWLATHKLQ